MTTHPPRPTPDEVRAALLALFYESNVALGHRDNRQRFITQGDPTWLLEVALHYGFDGVLPAPDLAALAVVLRALGWQDAFPVQAIQGEYHWWNRNANLRLTADGWALSIRGPYIMRWSDPGALPRLLCCLAGLSAPHAGAGEERNA